MLQTLADPSTHIGDLLRIPTDLTEIPSHRVSLLQELGFRKLGFLMQQQWNYKRGLLGRASRLLVVLPIGTPKPSTKIDLSLRKKESRPEMKEINSIPLLVTL